MDVECFSVNESSEEMQIISCGVHSDKNDSIICAERKDG